MLFNFFIIFALTSQASGEKLYRHGFANSFGMPPMKEEVAECLAKDTFFGNASIYPSFFMQPVKESCQISLDALQWINKEAKKNLFSSIDVIVEPCILVIPTIDPLGEAETLHQALKVWTPTVETIWIHVGETDSLTSYETRREKIIQFVDYLAQKGYKIGVYAQMPWIQSTFGVEKFTQLAEKTQLWTLGREPYNEAEFVPFGGWKKPSRLTVAKVRQCGVQQVVSPQLVIDV